MRVTTETIPSTLRTMAIVAVVIVGGVGAVGTAGGISGLTVDQYPVEYQALDSGEYHVEVVFDEPIDPADYAFTVVDADGNEVADNDDVNKGLRFDHPRQVTLDVGDLDLDDGATLRVEGDGVDLSLPITTTDGFVQEEYPHEPSIEPGDSLALVDLWSADQYYEITTADGTVVDDGTLGEHSFVAAIDTTNWDDGESYAVKFGENTTTRSFSIQALPEPDDEDGSDSLPAHVAGRTGTWFTDYEPTRPGTTVKFDYGLTMGAIVFSDGGGYGTTSTTIDRWETTPPGVPHPTDPADVVSMLDVRVHTTGGDPPTMTVRLPVHMSGVDGNAEDLVVMYFDGEEWVPLETTIVDRTDFYGGEMATVEATAPEPGAVAIVVSDG